MTRQDFPNDGDHVLVPDAAAAISRARRAVEEWPLGEQRTEALFCLEGLVIGLDPDLPLLYHRGESHRRLEADVEARLVDLLLVDL